MERKTFKKLNADTLNIIHMDMDAFYASVEEVDNPKIKGLPVIVGGTTNHGIVTTANYNARKYGVHSAMPIFMAKKKCPHGYYIPPRMNRYKEASMEVFKILYQYTNRIEQISIDEAYLDISHISMEPIKLVENIKKEIKKNIGLTLSVGISYNKFLAKLGSDWNKPNGIKIIKREMVPEILLPLLINKVHGIGPKSAKKLNDIGIFTIEDLLRLSKDFLVGFFGKSGEEIYQRIRGIDHREINTFRERKSMGTERTFEGTKDKKILIQYLERFSMEIAQNLQQKGIQAKTITLKLKDEHFILQTRSKTLSNYVSSFKEIYEIALHILEEVDMKDPIRLIGLTASNLMDIHFKQISIFDEG